jgi:hypothetical protein
MPKISLGGLTAIIVVELVSVHKTGAQTMFATLRMDLEIS